MKDGSRIQLLNILAAPSKRRNTIISDIFSRLQIMERRGSGLTRIIDEYAKSERKPEFYSDESTFRVVLPNLMYKEIPDISSLAASKGITLSPDEERICSLILETPEISIRNMATQMNVPYKRVQNICHDLQGKGFIKREGSQRRGIWQIIF